MFRIINVINFTFCNLIIITIIGCTSNIERSYYDNGQIKEKVSLKNGKPHGMFCTYYENGRLESKCYFNEGLRQGKGIFYYPNGVIYQIVYYHNDIIVKSATFRKDGSLEIVKEYNHKGQMINYNFYLDSGKVDPDPFKKNPLFISENDTVKKGELYRAEIRLGHKFKNDFYVFLCDTMDQEFFKRKSLKRKYKDVSILEIDTDTLNTGLNVITGIIFELSDSCETCGWIGPFKHEFYVVPVDSNRK